uniref:C2 domain-containing protein n=2 Tax=Haplochromini TaxID=319058 RepID=A0A3B4EVS7_9CICH
MASRLCLLLLILCSLHVAQCGLRVYNVYARGIRPDPGNNNGDGYVRMSCGPASKTTNVVFNTPDPNWHEELHYSRASPGNYLELRVYDKDVIFDDLLGICAINIQKGTRKHYCNLPTGGYLYFTYTLS